MTLEIDTERELEQATARIAELEHRIDELGRRLLEADARLSRIPQLEVELREFALVAVERDEARMLLERSRAVSEATTTPSLSQRLTGRLRSLKARVRRGH